MLLEEYEEKAKREYLRKEAVENCGKERACRKRLVLGK